MTTTVSQFEPELEEFDRASTPPGGNVFYGSSSFRLWENIPRYFPGIPVVNRGFGGSTLAECLELMPRLIEPLQPATLLLYAADNDLDQGASPEKVLDLFHQFIDQLRGNFPGIPMAFISVKPSPARFWNLSKIRRANELIQAAAEAMTGVTYLDAYRLMLSPAGGSRPDLFTQDGLHMNSAGYDLWAALVRPWLENNQK